MKLKNIFGTLAAVPTFLKLGRVLKPRPTTTRDCLAARMEATAARYTQRTAVIFEGRTITWGELNQLANRYAAALKRLGLARGDAVSLVMENRIEFLASLIAINKIGAISALVNTNLTGGPLSHCINITNCSMCLFGEEQLGVIEAVRSDPKMQGIDRYLYVPDTGQTTCPAWACDLAAESLDETGDNPPETASITIGETALYIFTSGTTGLPKASVLSNRRFLGSAALSAVGGLKCNVKDCIYLCLPLYHGTGLLLGVGAAFHTGASMFIRRKFSASNFLSEVRENNVTCFMYIGELCRYLLNTPEQEEDSRNPLRTIMGNGLRPDIWLEFKRRFGIRRVAEFYGSSEGNLGFLNVLNKDCTVGTTSLPAALVKYNVDTDEIVRDSNGHCIKVDRGEVGLLLGEITEHTAFEGYTSAEETEKKILRNALKAGDAWFNTGDLMKTVDVGFALGLAHYQFVDRVGDTYRWKSENVSTNEVGEIINSHPQIAFCNVYGVAIPRADGRAGMAAMVLAEGVEALDLQSFSAFLSKQLPSYARPVFLRIQPQIDTTGTFKMVKGDLRKQGYDIDQVDDPLYVLKPGADTYEPLDPDFAAVIKAGKAGF